MNTEGQVIDINGQSFLNTGNALEEIGKNIIDCINNIKVEMERLNNEKTILSSIRLEKSCNSVTKVGNDCIALGDIEKDIGNVYDTVNVPSMGRSL